MLRALIIALACLAAAPAAAQTTSAEAQAQAARASRALSMLWRPVTSLTNEQITRACSGAEEEIEAVEAAMPPVLTPDSLANVRALWGLLIIPTDDPAVSYLFPDMGLAWLTPGLGAVGVVSEAEGFIGLQDAAGHEVAVQIGTAGGRGVMRLRNPEGQLLTFVACAPTWGP